MPGLGAIIMGRHDLAQVARVALRAFLDQQGLRERVLVPEDGETCVFERPPHECA